MHLKWAGVAVAGIVLMGWGLRTGTVEAAQDDAARPEFYTTEVVPILKANCYKCHGGMFHRGGLNMGTREGLLKGGHHGPAIVPGDPANSWLVRLMRHEGPADDPMAMPPKGPKLSDADIAVVQRWVKAGAMMPEDGVKP